MKSEGWPSTLLSLLFVHWLVHLLSCSPVVSCVGRQQAVIEYRIALPECRELPSVRLGQGQLWYWKHSF